jgi:hypothetical protein
MFVLNDFLLNLNDQGKTAIEARARSLGLNVPAKNPETGEQGMIHVRLFTDNQQGIPGHYLDALPAQVRREYHVVGMSLDSVTNEHIQIDPETGGTFDLQIAYKRGLMIHVEADRPNFPLWSAVDTRVVRVYQEESVIEFLRASTLGLNHVQEMKLQVTIPELADLFDGSEQLVSIFGNPHYVRKVFSPVKPGENK